MGVKTSQAMFLRFSSFLKRQSRTVEMTKTLLQVRKAILCQDPIIESLGSRMEDLPFLGEKSLM